MYSTLTISLYTWFDDCGQATERPKHHDYHFEWTLAIFLNFMLFSCSVWCSSGNNKSSCGSSGWSIHVSSRP